MLPTNCSETGIYGQVPYARRAYRPMSCAVKTRTSPLTISLVLLLYRISYENVSEVAEIFHDSLCGNIFRMTGRFLLRHPDGSGRGCMYRLQVRQCQSQGHRLSHMEPSGSIWQSGDPPPDFRHAEQSILRQTMPTDCLRPATYSQAIHGNSEESPPPPGKTRKNIRAQEGDCRPRKLSRTRCRQHFQKYNMQEFLLPLPGCRRQTSVRHMNSLSPGQNSRKLQQLQQPSPFRQEQPRQNLPQRHTGPA